MIRNIICIIFFLLIPFLWSEAAIFKSCVLPKSVYTCSLPNRYLGLMDVSMSKGKTFKGRQVTFSITNNILYCDFPKMGKMPGKLTIDLPVQIHEDGTITALEKSKAGVMKMPLGLTIKLKLGALEDAKLIGSQLTFTLNVYGVFMGSKFPTTIYFHGDKILP